MDFSRNAIALSVACAFLAAAVQGAGSSIFAVGAYTRQELGEVETSREAEIRSLREQEINQLRITLGRRVPSNRKADLYFRLAELYLEAYHAQFLLEGRTHEQRVAQKISDPFIDRSSSKPFLKKGIQASEEVLRVGIPYSKMDHIYYFLGFNHKELGNLKQSSKYFELLVSQFPQSPFAVEGYRELADAAFMASHYREALGLYENAVRLSGGEGGSPLNPRLLHRLSWSYYRTRQLDRAIDTMKRAINVASKSEEKFLAVKEEALRDLAIFMTEKGDVRGAIAYFKNVAGDDDFYAKALERLAKEHERAGEIDKAIHVYESLLKIATDSELALSTTVKLVDLDLRRGNFQRAVKRVRESTQLGRSEGQNYQNLKAMIRRTGTERHDRFRKKESKSDLQTAEEFYQLYLDVFLKDSDPRKEVPEIQMYLAEVKKDLGKSHEAGQLYRKVLDSGDKRYAKEAAALWVAMLAESLKGTEAAKRQEPSVAERQFVDAADSLQETLPGSTEAREASLRAAQILAGYPATQKQARKRAKNLMDDQGNTIQGVTAARLWLQMVADVLPDPNRAKVGEYKDAEDELKEAIGAIRKNEKLLDADAKAGAKLSAMITELERKLRVGTIALYERDKDFASAAKAYESFASDQKGDGAQEKAFENSVVSYMRAGDTGAVVRVCGVWLNKFPKSSKAQQVARNAATELLIRGDFSASVDLFERIGITGRDREALETGSHLAEALDDLPRAVILLKALLRIYPNAPTRHQAVLSLARILEKQNKDSEAAQSYKLCAEHSSNTAEECGARLGDLFLRFKDLDRAKKNFKTVSDSSRAASTKKGKKQLLSPYVGYARYRLAELKEQEIESDPGVFPLALPSAKLQQAITQRLKFLEVLSKAYLESVDVGGPWGIAGLYRLSAWVNRFADEVDRIEAPANAQPQDVARFRQNLKNVSDSLRKRAVESWKNAYQRAAQFEILSPVLPEIYDRLADLRVPGFTRAQGYPGKFRVSGIAANGGKQGKDAIQLIRNKLIAVPKDASAWCDYGNLLWGEGKPMVASIAYQRALELDPKNASALNNRGAVKLLGAEEDWLSAAEANNYFLSALESEALFIPARFNRAILMNYYRLFRVSSQIWEQVAGKAVDADIVVGRAISQQGLGRLADADEKFKTVKTEDNQLMDSIFYHAAARAVASGNRSVDAAKKCLSALDDMSNDRGRGFDDQAAESLRTLCISWKVGRHE